MLVVYDDQQRYREACFDLANDLTVVLDASEGSIPTREVAMQNLQKIGYGTEKSGIQNLLIYVPAAVPESKQDKMLDPYWVHAEIGDVFPRKAGDDFEQICLAFKADHATEIRSIFSTNPCPNLDTIDRVGAGGGWPTLESLLDVESTQEILSALLAPTDFQQSGLNSKQPWVSEAKDLLLRSLGMQLVTEQTTHTPVKDELWRFILYSEFVFDLPEDVELPDSLKSVPSATKDAKELVYSICHRMRQNNETQALYIEQAQEVQTALQLEKRCNEILQLGNRDTFPFEERSFFLQCVDAIKAGDLDRARTLLTRNKGSVWVGLGESQAQWNILKCVVHLVEKCGDCQSGFSAYTKSLDKVIFFYIDQFYKVDQLHRELEHAVGDHVDYDGTLVPAIESARQTYFSVASDVQTVFTKQLVAEGWPPAGIHGNSETFTRQVKPHLTESGKKIAYIMIDALRYELGAVLVDELDGEGNAELQAACAVIPTVTPIGMTSLLPDAESQMRVEKNGDDFQVMMGEMRIDHVDHRMKWIENLYGQRFKQIKLDDVKKAKFVEGLADHVELLVIRSSSIDSAMENALQPGLAHIKNDIQTLRVAMHRLREAGFDRAVIATDHGFCLNANPDSGDTCKQPSGTWKDLHHRCLLGDGAANSSNWVCESGHLGLKGDFPKIAGPKSFACYTANNQYFHGGASLQEAVVPCISVQLKQAETEDDNVVFSLRYKRGATKVTTKIPVLEVSVTGGLFSETAPDVILKAVTAKGEVVGEPKPGGVVNPATGTIALEMNQSAKVPVKMSNAFEGKFKIQLIDASTLAELQAIDLETDYMV